jgi:hypothetical protein
MRFVLNVLTLIAFMLVPENSTSKRKSASGPGVDLSAMRKEVQANTKEVSNLA